MAHLRARYILTGLLIAVGLALLLGAEGHSWAPAVTFAALSLTDALLTAAALLVAAMASVAGALVVADTRADVAATQAWQGFDAELVMVGTPADATRGNGIDAPYTSIPQDQGLRRILLAHRFIVPVPSLSDGGSAATPSADAVAAGEIDGVQSGTELLIADQHPAAERHRAPMAETSDAAFDCSPPPIAGKLKEIGRRGQRSTNRRVSRELLVANAGVWWQYPNRSLGDARRAPAGACAAYVIVLTDRSSRDGNPAHREVTPEPATTAQPGCRGPPAGVSQQQVSPRPEAIGKSLRENVQSRAYAAADPAVVDNLGDRIPVGAAELEVVETYFDDLLGEVLAAVASDQDHQGS